VQLTVTSKELEELKYESMRVSANVSIVDTNVSIVAFFCHVLVGPALTSEHARRQDGCASHGNAAILSPTGNREHPPKDFF
jgi:hypothetical protein